MARYPSKALDQPVFSGGNEYSTGDMELGKPSSIILHDDKPIDREQVIIPVESPMASNYIAKLAFNEEPMTIRIERSAERFSPNTVPCWVNGIGAEVLMQGKWIQLGYLPVGVLVTTKRKYVEVLARARHQSIDTEVARHDESETNEIGRSDSQRAPFSVIKDENPAGYDWLTRLMAQA